MCEKKLFVFETGGDVYIVKANSIEEANEKVVKIFVGHHPPWQKEMATKFANACLVRVKEVADFDFIEVMVDDDCSTVNIS